MVTEAGTSLLSEGVAFDTACVPSTEACGITVHFARKMTAVKRNTHGKKRQGEGRRCLEALENLRFGT